MNPSAIAFIIVFIWGIWAIFEKKLALTVHPLNGMIYFAVLGFILIPVYYLIGRAYGVEFTFNKEGILIATFAQILSAIGGLLFLYLLIMKPSAWAVGITAAYPIVTMLAGKYLLKEELSFASIIGIFLVTAGLVVLGMEA